jgi:hypothetical protein
MVVAEGLVIDFLFYRGPGGQIPTGGMDMAIVIVPIRPDKVQAWQSFNEELNTSKKAEFEAFNKRYQLTRHRTWYAETPGGPLVVVEHEGPGAETFMPKLASSTEPFDKWIADHITDIHGIDLSKPPEFPPPELKLDYNASS